MKQIEKERLRSLRSPDQLDRAIQLASPANWLANLLLMVIVIAIVTWAIIGELPTRVTGLGMLFPDGGKVFKLVALQEGLVREIRVETGQEINAGELVAVISRDIKVEEIKAEEEKLQILEEQYESLAARASRLMNERQNTHNTAESALKNKIKAYHEKLIYLRDRLGKQAKDLKAGYITIGKYRSTHDEIVQTEFQVTDAQQKIEVESLNLTEFLAQQRKSMDDQERQLAETRINVATLKTDKRVNEHVVSPVDAQVVQISSRVGDYINKGASVINIMTGSGSLVVKSFFRTADGKRLAPGMTARVSVSSADPSIYGTAIGTVKHVSKLPVSLAYIQDLLENETLSKQMLKDGSPIYALIQLTPDLNTPSGIAWSSSKGPPFTIDSGTLANVAVTVASEPPINYLAPIFPAKIGLVKTNND